MMLFDGGWIMCYFIDDKVNLKMEVIYDEKLFYGINGYRIDCNKI